MVPAHSHKVSRVSWYSGYRHVNSSFAYGAFTLSGWLSQNHSGRIKESMIQSEPQHARTLVWALSRSLAATWEISVDFFSSGYWDVSLPLVRFYTLQYRWHCCRVSPFGYLRLLRPLSACLSFSQISTSFLASWRHGIHHVRLFTWPYNPGLLLNRMFSFAGKHLKSQFAC